MGGVNLRQAFRRARQINLDHLGRAGPNEEQLPDVGAAVEQTRDLSIKLFMRVRHPGQIGFFENRCPESGLCKDHNPGCGLQQVCTSA